ncbi:GNAT family N-acetyltransferase [Streptomyces sp. NPDC051310]|uniref:GNAT family N-acetyltransferase n=1 Tax=Streptomyces sp. NPDC051310 TaxID=3365649 RepID=UPI0037A045E5
MQLTIRDATAGDWPAIRPFFRAIVAAGDTFTYPLDLSDEQGRAWWLLPAPNRTVVAVDDATGTVVGTAKMNNNQGGNGAHIASASYMVDPAHGGRGVGRALVEESLRWARAAGFRGMQFNAVVETNAHAVRLYESLGFRIIGTVPEGFRHPERGYVGLHIMYRPL